MLAQRLLVDLELLGAVSLSEAESRSARRARAGINLGHLWGEIDRIRGWGEQILGLWMQGVIKPKIAQSFTFDEAAAAHHFIQDRKNIGKVLLVP
jgi:synaptic vesicle membrane protein VAT-1